MEICDTTFWPLDLITTSLVALPLQLPSHCQHQIYLKQLQFQSETTNYIFLVSNPTFDDTHGRAPPPVIIWPNIYPKSLHLIFFIHNFLVVTTIFSEHVSFNSHLIASNSQMGINQTNNKSKQL